METITVYSKVGLPNSYDQLMNTKYDISQIINIDPDNPDKSDWKDSNDVILEGIKNNVNTNSKDHHGISINPITNEEFEYTLKDQYYYTPGFNKPQYNCIFTDKSTHQLKLYYRKKWKMVEQVTHFFTSRS